MELIKNQIILKSKAVVTLSYWYKNSWQPFALTCSGSTICGNAEGITVCLALNNQYGSWDYHLSFESDFLSRIQLKLSLIESDSPFHLIPCCIFGDNNLDCAEPGHFPNLTTKYADNVSCSTYWEFRSDRASQPVSCLYAGGTLAAISVDPYSANSQDITNSREGFIRNGVFSQLKTDSEDNACGITLGYKNLPCSFINKDQWGVSTEHLSLKAETKGKLYLKENAVKSDIHRIIKDLYCETRSIPATPISTDEAVKALTHAFCYVNWQEEKQNFSNMNVELDPEKTILRAWRTLAEVGWTGGGVIGYPLLIASQVHNNDNAFQKAVRALNWVAEAYNPKSGLLWDVCGEQEGKKLDWWWSGYIVKGVHCAYTNASAAYYLLKSAKFLKEKQLNCNSTYIETACKVLDTICRLQKEDGNYGYTYSPEEPKIIDDEGFAGSWFVPAMVLAYQVTNQQKYLDSAIKAAAYYYSSIQNLNCWGTPMDTWKSLEQEGNLGFIRGAKLLHETTGQPIYLEMLENSAHYEYLWRYGFRARPEFPPLKNSHWNSCGGSVTSVSNPHIHPMGVFISSELKYLAEQTNDDYHQMRYEDGLNWGINIVSLYPDVSGYGIRGVLTERYCPSDGLTIQLMPDGSPSSIWRSYNGWAAAAVLEGLAEKLVMS